MTMSGVQRVIAWTQKRGKLYQVVWSPGTEILRTLPAVCHGDVVSYLAEVRSSDAAPMQVLECIGMLDGKMMFAQIELDCDSRF